MRRANKPHQPTQSPGDGDQRQRVDEAGIAEVARQLAMCRGLSIESHEMIQHTATTPASVGVNQPVRMPPSRITGIISGSAADLVALVTAGTFARDGGCPRARRSSNKSQAESRS